MTVVYASLTCVLEGGLALGSGTAGQSGPVVVWGEGEGEEGCKWRLVRIVPFFDPQKSRVVWSSLVLRASAALHGSSEHSRALHTIK